MNRRTIIAWAVGLAVVGAGVWWWEGMRKVTPDGAVRPVKSGAPSVQKANALTAPAPEPGKGPARQLLAEEKLARVEQISRDYAEIRKQAMVPNPAQTGAVKPADTKKLLEKLALLEREMHRDLAAVLTPRELEDYELTKTSAGSELRRRLDGATVSDEAFRAAFRILREFDLNYGITFDLAPEALLERQRALLVAKDGVRAALGDALFSTWLRRGEQSYPMLALFVEHELQMPTGTAITMWRVRQEYEMQNLELRGRQLPREQLVVEINALKARTRAQMEVLIGPAGLAKGETEQFGWLKAER